MILRSLHITLLILLISSCKTEKKDALPYSEDKVVDILLDARVVDEMVKNYREIRRDSFKAIYMDTLYKVHDIDSTAYNDLIRILEADHNMYYQLEDKVHKKLKVLMDDVD